MSNNALQNAGKGSGGLTRSVLLACLCVWSNAPLATFMRYPAGCWLAACGASPVGFRQSWLENMIESFDKSCSLEHVLICYSSLSEGISWTSCRPPRAPCEE